MLTSTREASLLILFRCVQVDCSPHINEPVLPLVGTAEVKAYKENREMFRWRCLEVFAFPNQGPGSRVTLKPEGPRAA